MLLDESSTKQGNLLQKKNTMSDGAIMVTKKLFCGGIAGTTACVIGQPLDLIKIRLQTEPKLYKSAYSCFMMTVRDEGYRSFFRGMTAPLCSQFFQSGLMFTGESLALQCLQPGANLECDKSAQTAVNVFFAGSFGGLVKCLVLVPSDLIKCKMQVDQGWAGKASRYSSSVDCFSKVYRSEGIRGLYKGFGVTTLREVPAFGLYFFVYRYSLNILDNFFGDQKKFEQKNASLMKNGAVQPGLTTVIAGGLAGSIAWICIYPFDVIKSHIQVSNHKKKVAEGGSRCMTIFETASHLYRQYGIKAFTRGMGVTIARAFPVNGAMLFTHESLKFALKA
jgi:Mitochondrial carrier protein